MEGSNMITSLLPYLQTCLAVGNLVIMLWALKKFLAKPHDTLESQLKTLEKRVDSHDLLFKDMKNSLDSSHEKHREQKEINTVFINCMLAFIDFEIAFCSYTNYEHTEDLVKAKQTLQEYLSNR